MFINRGLNKDVVHIYSGILLSCKMNAIMPFAVTWIQSEFIILSEVSQTDKDKLPAILIIHGI